MDSSRRSFRGAVRDYWSLTKSGLVFGNLITVIAGFAVATGGRIASASFVAVLAGMALVMASGCVFNNVIDRDLDARMDRTKDRALVVRRVSARGALWFAGTLGAAGFAVLAYWTTPFAVLAAAIGFVVYVFLYSMWGKRRTVYGTVIGAVAGAMPPVAGYAAGGGGADMAALILFVMLVTWQMAHFFSIAIRRARDYAAAGVPAMPVKYGAMRAKVSMVIYIAEFTLAAALLALYGYEGTGYLAAILLLGGSWLLLGFRGFGIRDDAGNIAWGKRMFLYSLVVMVFTFAAVAVGAAFPR